MNRFDLENQAIQRRIADALERIVELFANPIIYHEDTKTSGWSLKELDDNQKRAREAGAARTE